MVSDIFKDNSHYQNQIESHIHNQNIILPYCLMT